jgi:YrbI family 3-deoxy-D-manno-octulosonate 8-phosphate phosphatase
MAKTIAFIPVRGGSKSIPLKNIKKFNGKPLLYWVLSAANQSNLIDEVVVSTDSNEIKNVVEGFALKKTIVIDREDHLAEDTTSTEAVMLDYAKDHLFENIVLLQATSPLTSTAHIDEALSMYIDAAADGLLSVVRTHRFIWSKDGEFVSPVNYDYKSRPRRQDWNGQLVENGAIYITKRSLLLESKSRISGNIIPYIMPDCTYYEIDEPSDWIILEKIHDKFFKSYKGDDLISKLNKIKMVITDVDGVLTNGKMIYIGEELEGKEFHARDGMGFEILRNHNLHAAIITGESHQTIIRRAEKLQVGELHMGIKDKASIIRLVTKKYNLSLEQIAFIGDDLNDTEAMRLVGLSVAVADASDVVKNIADIVLESNGGAGAFREFVNFLLANRQDTNTSK